MSTLSSSRRCFLFAAALLTGLASAGLAAQTFSSSPTPAAANFAGLWRAAQLTLDHVHCTSVECSSVTAHIKTLDTAFLAGVNPAELFTQLSGDLNALDGILRVDLGADYVKGHNAGLAYQLKVKQQMAQLALTAGSSVFPARPLAGGLLMTEDCGSNCSWAFAANGALCALLPPPLSAACALAAVISYGGCLQQCNSQPDPCYDCGFGGGPWEPGPGPPDCGDEDCGLALPPPTPAQISAVAAQLSLRLSPAEVSAAMPVVRSVLNSAQ
jgi:hypothetical protein